MHEMSIAMNIVDLAVETAKNNDAKKINSIILELGKLSGVVRDALEFCFASACKGTIAEGAELEIIELKGMAHCSDCKLDFETDQIVATCPECNEYIFSVQGGRELKIKSLNVD